MAKVSVRPAAGTQTFLQNLSHYQQVINEDIKRYCDSLDSEIAEQYGEYSKKAAEAFTSLLKRGGKRIRGGLTICSYEMFGGTDRRMIIEAARTLEMLHAYILIIDDINDRSPIRRGAPTAHFLLKSYHEDRHLKDGAQHFGESIAMNAALLGAHQAQIILSQLNVSPARRLSAITNLNSCLAVTVHGQFNDLFNEVVETVERRAVENVLIWKTAYYTFMNPLQLGATLAGANGKNLELIKAFSLHAGRTFQITDDILGVFGEEFESGKSPLDDIREGKRTLLTVHALENSAKADAYFLDNMLGNHKLTQAEFLRCRAIIMASGALDFAKAEAERSANEAHAVLKKAAKKWDHAGIEFLDGLLQFLLERRS